jgi:sugar diacid utilization regulator
MEINKIIDRLGEFNLSPLVETGIPAYIETHKMIKPGQERFFSACLYVGYASELPPCIDDSTEANLICIDDAAIPSAVLRSKNLNLYLAKSGSNNFDILNCIADLMIDEATLVAWMRRVLDALYANVGLQTIIDVATEVFENPVFVNDTSFKILAMSHKTNFYNPTLEEEKMLGHIHKVNFDAMRHDKVIEDTRRGDDVVMRERRDADERWLFKSVKLHGIVVADIAIVDMNRPFRQLDWEMLDRMSQVVAIEMEKSDFYKHDKGVMRNYFLTDLLEGRLQNEQVIEQRLKLVGYKRQTSYVIVLIEDHRSEPISERIPYLEQQLVRLLPPSMWTVFRSNLVFLVGQGDRQSIPPTIRDSFVSLMRDNSLSAGISNSFKSLVDASLHYRQALHAVDVGVQMSHREGVFEFSEIMPFYVAQLITKRHDLREFLHPAVVELSSYDNANATQLLLTLDHWLAVAGDSTQAAERLHVHRNTLGYRLGRIRSITDVDLDDGNERLKLHLSIKALEYQSLLYREGTD